MIASVPTRRPAVSAAVVSGVAARTDETVDLQPILLHELMDMFGALAGVGTSVRYGTAEPDIVADIVDSVWILEQVIDVSQPDAKAPIHVPALMRFVPFRHLPFASEKSTTKPANGGPTESGSFRSHQRHLHGGVLRRPRDRR
jgi:hypothetical protein